MNDEKCRDIGRYISQIQRKGSAYISKELQSYGIGYGQFMFLIELYRGDGINQEELSEKLNIDKGTTARAIRKLEESGLLVRCIDEKDKRAYKLYVTEEGIAIKEDIYKVTRIWEDRLTQSLCDDEKAKLTELLEKICINQDIK